MHPVDLSLVGRRHSPTVTSWNPSSKGRLVIIREPLVLTMVDIMGHIAMGLLWASPAWFFWRTRVSIVFIGFTTIAALFPDIDIWFRTLFPGVVHHHGVLHTVVFVVLSSLVVGALVAVTLARPIDRWLGSDRFDARDLFVFAAGAMLLGGLSHLFTDMLSAPDIAQPIEPFWPVYQKPWSVDLIWYNSPWWNAGLLTVAVLLHLGLAYLSDPVERSPKVH